MPSLSEHIFTFVRHAESVGNAENRLQGLADYPLSEKGQAQALALGKRWQAAGVTFDHVIASPLSRTLQTAQIIAAQLGINEVETDPIWVERDNGKRSGMTWEEVQIHYPESDFINPYGFTAETGEGDWALYLRAGKALHSLLLRPPARYLIASHGAILNAVYSAILGITVQPSFQGARFRMHNTSFSTFHYDYSRHRWRVQVIGDTNHLTPEMF